MSNHTSEIEFDSLAIGEFNFDYSYAALPGILFAGAIYPALIFVSFFVLAIGSILGNPGINFIDASATLFALAAMVFVWCLIGFLTALVFGSISILAVNFFNFAFRNFLDVRSVTGLAGGMAGFVPFAILLLIGEVTSVYWSVVYVLVGPTLAMLVGTGCAMWYLERNFHHEIDYFMQRRSDNFQFRIFHIMLLTGLVAVVIAISQLFNQVLFAQLVGFWVLMQTLSIWFLRMVLRRPCVIQVAEKCELRR